MMSESQTTTTTVNVTTTKAEPVVALPRGLKLNTRYITSLLGIIQIVQQVIALICMGCASPQYFGAAQFFVAVMAICFIMTLLFYIVNILSLKLAAPSIPWLLIELAYSAGACFFYILSACIHMGVTEHNNNALKKFGGYYTFRDAYIAAGVIALINGALFGVIAFFLFKEYKSSSSPANAQTQPQ